MLRPKFFRLVLFVLLLAACAPVAQPTANPQPPTVVLVPTATASLTNAPTLAPTRTPAATSTSTTTATRTALPLPTSTPTIAPSATRPILPTLSSAINAIVNQSCSVSAVTDFNSCNNAKCCQTNNACNTSADCRVAQDCMLRNGGMRSYNAIAACITQPGIRAYMSNFACRFQNCGNYMSLNDGEKCLTQHCVESTMACFSNPACFAIKYCVVDKAGTPDQCIARYPNGRADFERWSTCGRTSGCYAMMPDYGRR